MDPKVAARVQQEMSDESKRMAEAGKKLQSLLSQRQKLLTQQSENEMVETELRSLQQAGGEEGKAGQLWKLVGPVLVKVELDEAQANVKGRSQFFKDEMSEAAPHCAHTDALQQPVRFSPSASLSLSLCVSARLERQQKDADDSRRASQEKLMRLQETVRKAQQGAVQSRLSAS
jgi:chaperonin cofactor prefoldin